MSQLIGVTPKAVTVQGYQLQSSQDMHDALAYLSGLAQPYTGSINRGDSGQGVTWWLTFVNVHGTGFTAELNDWVILENGSVATVCRAVDFDTFYAVA